MTNEETIKDNNLAQHIASVLGQNSAEVSTQPAVPPHIATNLLEFLRRVESKGMEAVAWVEAYQFVQKHVPQPQTKL